MSKQLCESRVGFGELDFMIEGLIRKNFTDDEVMKQMMDVTKGSENPALIKQRIEEKRKEIVSELQNEKM